MQNKEALLNLVNRAERGVLLADEAKILRDAIELLDDMAMTLHEIGHIETEYDARDKYEWREGYEPSTTQTFRVIDVDLPARKIVDHQDDDAPGRP